MPVIKTYQHYFRVVHEFNSAPSYSKELLLRGPLLSECFTMTPPSARQRLRQFWDVNAAKYRVERRELKSWH